jgi:P27 family predicted phage terminase small subunit
MPRERKTLEEHALQSTRPQYVLPDSEVVASRPKIPTEFKTKPHLRKLFKKYCQELEQRGTLTFGDGDLIRMAVLSRDSHERAIAHLQVEGEIVTYQRLDADGHSVDVVRPNLWLKVAQDAAKALLSHLDRLGLTPANRNKIKPAAKPKPDTSKDDALLSREESQRQKQAAADAAEAEGLLDSIPDEALQ